MINWNGYFVCEDGTIYNKNGSIKSLVKTPKGYLTTSFYYDGGLHSHHVHKVVAEVYLGKRPTNLEIDHIDNDRTNNHKDNLRYVSKSENNQKAYDSGNRDVSGFNNANSRYGKAELYKAKQYLDMGFSYGKVVKITGINKGTVAKIAQGKYHLFSKDVQRLGREPVGQEANA